MTEDRDDISDIDLKEVDKALEAAKEHYKKLCGDYSLFIQALASDTRTASAQLMDVDNQFQRRTHLRTLFAGIEGALFARRTLISELLKYDATEGYDAHRLSHADRMLLDEIEYDLEDNGAVRTRNRNFQPFLKYSRFTLDVYFKYFRRPNPVDYAGTGWQAFRNAHEVRNRITHPKRISDLTISDEELHDIRSAAAWFTSEFSKR